MNTETRMTATVVAYTSAWLGHVTRLTSFRTSARNTRIRSNRPPAASLTASSDVGVWAAMFASSPCSFSTNQPWQARRESNPQPPVLETGALPIELLACFSLGIADGPLHSAINNPQSAIHFDSR